MSYTLIYHIKFKPICLLLISGAEINGDELTARSALPVVYLSKPNLKEYTWTTIEYSIRLQIETLVSLLNAFKLCPCWQNHVHTKSNAHPSWKPLHSAFVTRSWLEYFSTKRQFSNWRSLILTLHQRQWRTNGLHREVQCTGTPSGQRAPDSESNFLTFKIFRM